MVVQRVCFLLRVQADRQEEYRRRHQAVWPEMQRALRETGWGNYTLFLAPDGLLVGYLETDDFSAAQARMAAREVNHRWQSEMGDLFEQLGDDRTDEAMRPLDEVFHLD